MSDCTAYIFPQTLVQEPLLFSLAALCPSLVYLQGVEDDPACSFAPGSLSQELSKRQQLRFHAPAPLGKERDRFLALVSDLEQRRDDYLHQLSALSLSHLADRREGESRSSLISELSAPGSRQSELEQLLWQARLVLKLGELFDREQQEIAARLQRLAAQQDHLLDELREESDSLFSLTRGLSQPISQGDGMAQLRLKAWSQLFYLGSASAAKDINCFITSQGDIFEKCLDLGVNEPSQPPFPSVSIELPAAPSSLGTPPQSPPPLPGGGIFEKLCCRLLDQSSSPQDLAPLLSQWEQQLERLATAGEEGSRSRLTLQPFAGQPLQLLLGPLSHSEDNRGQTPACLIGLWEQE
ncbi:hypothetical protein [Desulfogranum mediterraneum]|uniref:hypothetical protein n=1 Tax=Desulfogranum mediterraneum TaxID=160661 RepID=UPI0004139135|nr:hypothetical protein [Desulfogranum mediterraneum]